MRNIIKYFYNLNIDEINEYSNYCIVRSEENIYVFKIINNGQEILKNYDFLITKGAKIHAIVTNNKGDLISTIDSKEYVLLKIADANKIVGNNFELYYFDKIEDEIPKIWSEKIDYYMNYMRNNGVGKKLLVDAFNYYIGLSENAIAIYNRTLQEPGMIRYVNSHKRINYPNYGINYYDPTNIIVDSISRDISEYIKSKILIDSISVDEIISMIYKYQLNSKEIKILYSRLLFPSYFFDEVEKSINGDYEENQIIKILNKRKNIEILLREIYLSLKKNNQLPEIDWIMID